MRMFKKMFRKITATALIVAFALTLATPFASAKTNPAGQTVGTVLLYITNASGEEILVSQIPVATLESDMVAGKIDDTLHNYSLLDQFTTTVHQEAQGFTVAEFVEYAQAKSTVDTLRALPLTFTGADKISFWEMDQTGYDDMDTYTYDDLYSVPRYNFPLLYEYWDYRTQEYYDPSGKLSGDEVINLIFASGQQETIILSVRAFSQRYMATSEKFGSDYNLESYWSSLGLLDNQRTIRVMKPMTEAELREKKPTAMDSRYWTQSILLDMTNSPDIEPLGEVAEPTATVTQDRNNYYLTFDCATDGANIYYNQNFASASYMPTFAYDGTPVSVDKSLFPNGTVTITAHAVKDGYTDAGVVILKLDGTNSVTIESTLSFSDVKPSDWYYDAVDYVMSEGLFDVQSETAFGASAPMTRAALATALYRLEGSPDVAPTDRFSDVSVSSPISGAVSWAFSAGVINGNDNGTFTPDASITREQIAAMLFRYTKYSGAKTNASGNLTAFPDSDKVSGYALDAVTWAVGAKIINGSDGELDPQGTATRAQVAQILLNYGE